MKPPKRPMRTVNWGKRSDSRQRGGESTRHPGLPRASELVDVDKMLAGARRVLDEVYGKGKRNERDQTEEQ